jgi:hypothetical protein
LTTSVKPYLEDPSYTEDNLPWSKIAQYIPNRTGIQCQARWTEALDPSVRKGRWKKEEDELLKLGVERFGCCWIRVAGSISGRTQRQCRTRWNQIQSKQQKTLHETAVQQIKKQQQRNKKRRSTTPSEDDLLQWKADKPSPIQLGVPDQTPFIRLSNIQPSNAIVIPSDIPSPLAGTSEEDTDYFCSSPASTCSVDTVDFNNTTSSFFNTNKMDVNHFLDDFDSALSAHFSNNQTKYTTDDLLSSFLTPEYLSQLDPDLPSLVLSNPTQHVNLDHLLLDAEFITSS